MKANVPFRYFATLLACVLVYAGCISPKNTVASRGMQNLTARYNIIYNANIILDESERSIERAVIDDYDRFLSVHKEPSEAVSASETANLDSIINKANTIVNDKLHSKYVDDAYMLVAKANYLKSQFFNASEYLAYLIKNYPEEKNIRQEARAWRIRALLQLGDTAEASDVIDSALRYIETSNDFKSDVFAAQTQFLINKQRISEAILSLKNALNYSKSKTDKIRWRFILAQLQAQQGQYPEAYKNFSLVVKSNAAFDMAFNANLNRIKIEEQQNGENSDRITRLKSLLRDDKNKDFIDQIYYQIGNIHFEQGRTDEAISNFNTSIRKSTANQNQKGLSYLKIADIYFSNGNYVSAKAYYDSTLTSLSPKYPGYDIIKKKGGNLDLLAKRYQVIAREDTLQTLARLPEDQREERIGELVRQQSERAISQTAQQPSANNLIAGLDNPADIKAATEGKFYFNNTTALSQGFSDFKKRWGNRRLEDNWRRASKTAAESNIAMATDPDAPIGASIAPSSSALSPEVLRQTYISSLPLTEAQLNLSNQRVAEAYYDIANFYKDELKDDRTAIRTYEDLLKHSPNSTLVLPTYYNLYRLYQPLDINKSNSYRDLILNKYPESPFAKAIRDPNYTRDEDEKERVLNAAYDNIFNLYMEKKYQEVIAASQRMEQEFGKTKLSAQLAYLNALAVGHTQKLPALENLLIQITNTFADDKLVTPLAKEHLLYIQNNRAQMISRPTALLEFDPTEPSFVEEPAPAQLAQQAPIRSTQPVQQAPATNTATVVANDTPAQSSVTPPAETNTATSSVSALKPANNLFTLPAAGDYFMAINVKNPRYNLSSSRFGIGQFNRTKYSDSALKHQLQEAGNENQLILIGTFKTLEEVRQYEAAIAPLLKDIMKVPANEYSYFVVTKDNLDKLKDRKMIDLYAEFYKNSN